MRLRLISRLLAMLALVVGLAACGGLPSSSKVEPGLEMGAAPGDPLRYAYDGPSPDASPEQIVRGFLRAGAGFENDHEIARSFLAADVANTWKPEASVVVHAGESSMEMKAAGSSAVNVTISSVATIDGGGYYHQSVPGAHVTGHFTVERVAGEWRISALPKGFGLWLNELDLPRLYGAFSINYVDPVSHTMVPDIRWFPTGPGLATSLARAQLQPPPAYLAAAVDTGIPPGTILSVDAVSVENGLATVDLSSRALDADADHRRMMWAQFLTTLSQSPSVRRLTIQVAGAKLDLPGIPDEPSSPNQVGYPLAAPDQQPALLRVGTVLHRVNADISDLPAVPAPDGSAALPPVPVGWIDLAAPVGEPQLAAIGGDHKDLGRWEGTGFVKVPAFGTELTRPSFDSANGLWVAGHAGGASRLWTLDTTLPLTKARPRVVSVPWLGHRHIASFRMSSLDNRAVMILTDPKTGRDQIAITAVVRDAKGRAQRLTEPLLVGSTLTSVYDVVWLGDDAVAALGRSGTKEPVRPFAIDIGGDTTSLNPIEGARALTATRHGGEQGLLVLTDRGKLYTRAGASWIPYDKNVTGIVVPGS